MADRSGYIGRAPGDSQVIIARQTFTLTGVQTNFTFSSGYTSGYLDVYINGVRQINASDYTATDGSTVGLTTYATSGDVLELVAYKAFNLASVSSAAGDFSVGGDLTVSGTSNVGVVTGGTYYGDGSNLTGISTAAVPGINTERHSVFHTINASGITTAGAVRITDNLTPVAGQGLELFCADTSSSTIQSFDRTNGETDKLTLRGNPVELKDSSTVRVTTNSSGIIVTGICTATSFKGDGSGLSGVAAGGGDTDITSCLFI